MAYVGKRSSTQQWINNDGLVVTSGPGEATVTDTGVYRHVGGRNWVEVFIDCANLPTQASGNIQIQSDSVTIPNGAFIEEVRLTVTKETTGAGALLNVGLVDQDRVTVISDTALVSAHAGVNDGTDLGQVFVLNVGSTSAGALIGTKITNTGLITAFPTVASFTAGVVKCEVFFSMPLTADL